jgi:hypothetical protein
MVGFLFPNTVVFLLTFVLNPLNAELNPICHLLVILRDLTFMGPCIVSIFQYTCISNKMQRYTVYLYLETCFGWYFHPSSRAHKLYLKHLVFVAPLLPSAAIVEELEQFWVCCGWRTHSFVLLLARTDYELRNSSVFISRPPILDSSTGLSK